MMNLILIAMFSFIRKFVTGDITIPTVRSEELKEILVKSLGDMLVSNLIILSDETYTLVRYKTVQEMYHKSGLAIKQYHKEKFDCDDFSNIMKSFVANEQSNSWSIIYPYAFGLLYGQLPSPHAINWFVDESKTLFFMEPQNGEIFKPKGKIFFIYT